MNFVYKLFVKRTEWPQNSIDLNPLLLRLDGSAQKAKEHRFSVLD
jgi:hypothetical protein